jgi:hypothetical protein
MLFVGEPRRSGRAEQAPPLRRAPSEQEAGDVAENKGWLHEGSCKGVVVGPDKERERRG